MKLKAILENLERKIEPLMRKLSGLEERQLSRLARMLGLPDPDLESIIRAANKYDPTTRKATYTYWIVKALANSSLRLPDDAERLTGTLAFFDRIKKSKRFTDEKDINKYETFRELEQVAAKYQSLEDESQPTSLRQWEQWIKKQGVTLFYKDEVFTVLKFELTGKTEEVAPTKTKGSILQNWYPTWAIDGEPSQQPKVLDTGAIAVAKLATGTQYCVQNPVTAQDSYLKSGPLFGIFKRGELYMLSTETWGEIMNTGDMRLMKTDVTTAYFLSQYLLANYDKMPERAIQTIQRLIDSPKNPEQSLNKYRPDVYEAAMAIKAGKPGA
jgi:hypothetical protein